MFGSVAVAVVVALSPCRVVVAPHHLSWNFKHFQLSPIRMLHIRQRKRERERAESEARVASKLPKNLKKRERDGERAEDVEVNFSRFGICQSFRSSARVSFRQKFCLAAVSQSVGPSVPLSVSPSASAGCVSGCLRFIKIH